MTPIPVGPRSGAALAWGRRVTALLLAALLLAVAAPAGTANAQAQGDLVDTAVAAGQFTTLAAALQAAGLVDTLKGPGPFTVFAPTDAAFAKLPPGTVEGLLADPAQLRAVLTYHVVPGRVTAADIMGLTTATTVQGQSLAIEASDADGVTVGGAAVVTPDVLADNGVIHVIDAVLLPPALATLPQTGGAQDLGLPLAAGAAAGTANAQAQGDLVDTAVAAGQFTTLAAALQAAGLVDTLKGPGPFTVFAPTDAAFAKLPPGTVEGLLADPAQLTAVLTYHVVPGRVTAADIMGLTTATTVQGQSLAIEASDADGVTVGGAAVVTPDVLADNGVIHVIDAVLLPA